VPDVLEVVVFDLGEVLDTRGRDDDAVGEVFDMSGMHAAAVVRNRLKG
jgi:hypothetical protein